MPRRSGRKPQVEPPAGAAPQGCPCSLCAGTRRPLHCAHCVSQGLLAARRRLSQLQQQAAARRRELDERLAARAVWLQQRRRRLAIASAVSDARLEADAATAELAVVRAHIQRFQSENARRREELEGAREVLAAERSKTLGHLLPDVLRNCSLRHDRLAFDLAVERHIRLRELQEVLPLTLSPPAGSSAPVSLAASLRLAQPQPSQPSVAAAVVAVAGGVVPARQWPLIAAGPRVAAIAGAAAAPVQNRPVVRINGLLVPDGLAPTVDDGQEAQELGAALGYMTLFMDLAAAYLGSPLLHQMGFRGSYSAVWSPAGFWEPDTPLQGRKLRLYLLPSSAQGHEVAGSPAARSSQIQRMPSQPLAHPVEALQAFTQRSARSLWGGVTSGWHAAAVAAASAAAGAAESGRIAIMPDTDTARRIAGTGIGHPGVSGFGLFSTPRTPRPDGTGATAAAAEAGARAQEAGVQGMDAGTLQLGRALHALQRSASAVLADQLGPSGSRPPPEWGPLAAFAALCATASKEPQGEERPRGAPPHFGASSVFGPLGGAASSAFHGASTVYSGLAGAEEADPADGWERVERPMWGVAAPILESRGVAVPAAVLPPLPTEPELVEQWTRAMFTDHVGSVQQDNSGVQGMPLLARLQLLETFARGLSVAQLMALRDRILAGGSQS